MQPVWISTMLVEKRASIRRKTMHSPAKIAFRIYVLVFIFAKLYHCIDVSNETVSLDGNESTNDSSTTDTIPPDQTFKLDGTTNQPQENDNVMQICNQTFPTPKGMYELNKFGLVGKRVREKERKKKKKTIKRACCGKSIEPFATSEKFLIEIDGDLT